jgi:hypothetical protein
MREPSDDSTWKEKDEEPWMDIGAMRGDGALIHTLTQSRRMEGI